MFDPFSQQGAGELNVLKRHLQSTVLTLLDRNPSQREIHLLTGVDRKTIRRYQALRAGAEANSPGEVTTGSQRLITPDRLAIDTRQPVNLALAGVAIK